MAEILDARVKQKTGTAADFAGYTLLEGEIALVRTSASGPVFNFKVGPGNFDSLDWSLQNPGAAQKADTSTVFPAGVPGLYIPTESGTYDGVSVDLSSGYTQLIWDGSTLTKVVFPINLSGYATVDDLGFSRLTIDPAKPNLIIGKIVEGYVTAGGLIDTGAGDVTGWLRTREIAVQPGVEYTVDMNGFESGSKNMVFFNASRVSLGNWPVTSVPHRFTPPANTAYLVMNLKTPSNPTPANAVLYEGSGGSESTSRAGNEDIAAAVIVDNESNSSIIRRFIDRGLSVRNYASSGKNKLNELALVNGYVGGGGNVDTGAGAITAGWVRTGMTPVNGGTQYTLSIGSGFIPVTSKNMCFYDNAGTFISNINISTNPFTFTAPAGAEYLLANLMAPSQGATMEDLINVQLEEGDTATEYEPYPNPVAIGLYGNRIGYGGFSPAGTPLNPAWVNLYRDVYDKLPHFVSKYTDMAGTAENRCRIILLGDSLFARHEHTSVGNVVPSKNPPVLITKNIASYIWENITGSKPSYSRYDDGMFTEVGTWGTVNTNANWDDSGDRSGLTRRSTATDASFSFSVGSEHNFFNLIDRLDLLGCQDATVVVSQNGILQARIEGQGAWVEANGFVFSQKNPEPNYPNGMGNTNYQRRIEFKKVGSGVDSSISIEITKGTANSSTLMYWGLELIHGNKPYVQLINVARGGHTIDMLKDYYMSDVINKQPDLVVFEIPLLNMIGANPDVDYTVNSVWDFVWGNRPGAENVNSLKNLSNDWQDFNVLLIIPHHSRTFINEQSQFIDTASGFNVREIYNAVKGLIYQQGDLPYIDVSSNMLYEADADPLWNGDYYGAFSASGINGNGYFADATHQNNKGTIVWAKHVCPIFKIS